ncbi:UNVERIFIED_CONTAM: hypothetical protein FKN15_024400 [Acipenser sinensis]
MVGPGANGAATGPVASLAAVLNSCDPICVTPCSLQAMHRLRGGGAGAGGPSGSAGSPGAQALDSGVSGASGATGVPGSSRRGRVAGMRLASEGVTQKGSFINKPTQGWLHPDKKILGPGAAYIVRVGLTSDGYLCADGRPPGCRDYEEHLYVNTQSLENWEPGSEGAQESPKKDLFDMRPFEDALKLHEAGGESPALEDSWPSPPRRRAPIAPTEEQLRHEPWYHGRMSRRDAEKLLAMDGDFLVRDSVTNPGQYVLTGMHSGLPKHLLLVDPEGVVRTKDVLFDSISHLISYHLQDGLPIVAAESELHLKQVVRRKQ